MLKHCPDRCKTQTICDEVADTCLQALKSAVDLLIKSKMFQILDVVFSNDDIALDYISDDIGTFFTDDIDIDAIDLNKNSDLV